MAGFSAEGIEMLKNARLFRLQEPFALDAAALEERLATRRFRPCGPLETVTLGWTAPCPAQDGDGTLVHSLGGRALLICARRQERLLPATVVAETLDERVAEIEAEEVRSVGRAERRRLRETIMTELLPRAFTRSRRILAYVDRTAGWLVVDAASDKIAEELVSLLRETLGSLPATPPRPDEAPTTRLTAWVAGGTGPDGFELGDACELRDPQDSQSVVRCRGQDLAGEEIAAHLHAGKQVVQLALAWAERLDFVLTDDLALKRLRLADGLLDDLADGDDEDPVVRFEAELTILVAALGEVIEQLAALFALGHAAGTAGEPAPPANEPRPPH